MDDCHAALVGELPEILRSAAYADLDGALGVEHAVQDRQAERAAMLKLRALVGTCGVAMGVDMDHPDRLRCPDRLQDGGADRVIAADRERTHARSHQPPVEGFDIAMAKGKIIAALHGHIADIGNPRLGEGRALQDVIVRADPLDGADRTRSEAAPVAVRHSKSIGTPTSATSRPPKSGSSCASASIRRVEQRGNAREGPLALVRARELGPCHGCEVGIEHIAARGVGIPVAKGLQLSGIDHGFGSSSVQVGVTG